MVMLHCTTTSRIPANLWGFDRRRGSLIVMKPSIHSPKSIEARPKTTPSFVCEVPGGSRAATPAAGFRPVRGYLSVTKGFRSPTATTSLCRPLAGKAGPRVLVAMQGRLPREVPLVRLSRAVAGGRKHPATGIDLNRQDTIAKTHAVVGLPTRIGITARGTRQCHVTKSDCVPAA